LGLSLTVPAEALSNQDASLQVAPVTTQPAPNPGFQAGDRAFEVTLTSMSSGEPLTDFPAPIALTYTPSQVELALASQDLTRVSLAYWNGSLWAPVPCTATGQRLTCTLSHLSLFQLMVSSSTPVDPDFDLPNGHFYRQANSFAGAGADGFAVIDDASAAFWTEYQRLGGVESLGYPVSSRFTYHGYLTQAFQKAALQWRPDLDTGVPVNIFDSLTPAMDSWLDAYRQVPRSPDWSGDADQPWDEVMASHEALLDAYPPLHDQYFSVPDPVETYGLPLSVRQYDSMVVVRTQRATLQLWTVDTPWAAAGTVVVGNAGDLAKEGGLWPLDAIVPQVPPTADSGDLALDP
jgi:hypothetical protein